MIGLQQTPLSPKKFWPWLDKQDQIDQALLLSTLQWTPKPHWQIIDKELVRIEAKGKNM